MAPVIVSTAKMMLDKVRSGQLGKLPDDADPGSIRAGWL
jgi:hypothetical protein